MLGFPPQPIEEVWRTRSGYYRCCCCSVRRLLLLTFLNEEVASATIEDDSPSAFANSKRVKMIEIETSFIVGNFGQDKLRKMKGFWYSNSDQLDFDTSTNCSKYNMNCDFMSCEMDDLCGVK